MEKLFREAGGDTGGLATLTPVSEDPEAVGPIQAADAILGQGEQLLVVLSDEQYSRKLSLAMNSSIGEHYRHCLEHFQSLLNAVELDRVDYDRRQRDPQVETQRWKALQLTGALQRRLREISEVILARRIIAACQVNYCPTTSFPTQSSVAREMVYVVAHAIHHYALIAILARSMSISLPAHFGVAPSTLSHRGDLPR